MMIKVCGLRDPLNIERVAELNPDYMGFIFYPPSPRYVGNLPREVLSSVPRSIKRVGVFVDEQREIIYRAIDRYELDVVQLHGNETPQFCKTIGSRCGVIKATRVVEAPKYVDSVDYLLFDTPTPSYGGSGVPFDWSELNNYHCSTPFLLSGGIGPEHSEMIRKMGLFGVDINSRFETEPGIKNIELLKTFIHEQNK